MKRSGFLSKHVFSFSNISFFRKKNRSIFLGASQDLDYARKFSCLFWEVGIFVLFQHLHFVSFSHCFGQTKFSKKILPISSTRILGWVGVSVCVCVGVNDVSVFNCFGFESFYSSKTSVEVSTGVILPQKNTKRSKAIWIFQIYMSIYESLISNRRSPQSCTKIILLFLVIFFRGYFLCVPPPPTHIWIWSEIIRWLFYLKKAGPKCSRNAIHPSQNKYHPVSIDKTFFPCCSIVISQFAGFLFDSGFFHSSMFCELNLSLFAGRGGA